MIKIESIDNKSCSTYFISWLKNHFSGLISEQNCTLGWVPQNKFQSWRDSNAGLHAGIDQISQRLEIYNQNCHQQFAF